MAINVWSDQMLHEIEIMSINALSQLVYLKSAAEKLLLRSRNLLITS